MEMNKTLGVLGEKIDRMRSDVDGMSTKMDATCAKVDSINVKLAWVAGICAGITGIVAIVWALINQVPWDRLVQPSSNYDEVGDGNQASKVTK